jgi:hypothetical protein
MIYRLKERACKRPAALAAVLSTFHLVSCTNEDRVVTVTCSPPPRDSISVDMGRVGMETRAVGFLNTRQFVAGTIIQLNPAATGDAHAIGSVVRVLQTSEGDFLPARSEGWLEDVVSASFRVRLDNDVNEALKPLHIDWEKTLVRDTALSSFGAKRRVLRDPLGLINADRIATALIREGGKTSRFVMVSAASYGNAIAIGYSAPSLAGNTVDISNFYLHLKYECSAVTKINSIAHSLGKPVPILIFFVAVKFDSAKEAVVSETGDLDFTRVDLAP